jgi:hypothetical protein
MRLFWQTMRLSIPLFTLTLAVCGCFTYSIYPTVHGIPNFQEVDKTNHIYRGAQPADADGWEYLKSLGVINVVKLNLKSEGSDDFAEKLQMRVCYRPITIEQQLGLPGSRLTNEFIDGTLAFIVPGTFIHCGSDGRTRSKLDTDLNSQGGQDRTGLICGCYRVRIQGKSKAYAQKEMESFGFHKLLHGLWDFWEDEVK